MNSPTDISTPTAAATSGARVKIGIVLFIHPDGLVVPAFKSCIAMLGVDAPLFMFQASQFLKLLLVRSGLPCEDLLPLGTGLDGSICFETDAANREAALEVAGAFCGAHEWFSSLAAICWFCESEGAWRAVRQSSNPIRLENYFTPETDRLHAERMKNTMERLLAIKAGIAGLIPPDKLP